jgi:hypothetical protein
MARVHLVDGRDFEGAHLTDIKPVGNEGSCTAIAHIDGHTYPVYKSTVDGYNEDWYEQMDYETWKALKGKKQVIEGTLEHQGG